MIIGNGKTHAQRHKRMNLKVGQYVKLNNFGVELIGGLASLEEAEAAKKMKVINLEFLGNDDHPDTYSLEVDGLLNRYMLTPDCVDLLPEAT